MNNPCGHLALNVDSVMKQLQDALVSVLEEGTETLLDIMREEIDRTVYGHGPGKPEWREALAADLREVYRVVANEVIEFGVGLPYQSYADAGYRFVRAMLVAYGSGNEGGGEPIHSRPDGLVWDDDLRDHQPSASLTEYDLPDAFNQEGNDFVNNAMKLMRTHFQSLLGKAGSKLPKGFFSSHTRTETR